MNGFEKMQSDLALSKREQLRQNLDPETLSLAEVLEPRFTGDISPQAQDKAMNRILAWQNFLDDEEKIKPVRGQLEGFAAVVLRAIYDLENRSQHQRVTPELEGLRSKLEKVEPLACKILGISSETFGAAINDELFDDETKATFNL